MSERTWPGALAVALMRSTAAPNADSEGGSYTVRAFGKSYTLERRGGEWQLMLGCAEAEQLSARLERRIALLELAEERNVYSSVSKAEYLSSLAVIQGELGGCDGENLDALMIEPGASRIVRTPLGWDYEVGCLLGDVDSESREVNACFYRWPIGAQPKAAVIVLPYSNADGTLFNADPVRYITEDLGMAALVPVRLALGRGGEGFRSASDSLTPDSCRNWIESVWTIMEQRPASPGMRAVLVGFSQGASHAEHMAVHGGVPVGGIFWYGGALPRELASESTASWLLGCNVGEADEAVVFLNEWLREEGINAIEVRGPPVWSLAGTEGFHHGAGVANLWLAALFASEVADRFERRSDGDIPETLTFRPMETVAWSRRENAWFADGSDSLGAYAPIVIWLRNGNAATKFEVAEDLAFWRERGVSCLVVELDPERSSPTEVAAAVARVLAERSSAGAVVLADVGLGKWARQFAGQKPAIADSVVLWDPQGGVATDTAGSASPLSRSADEGTSVLESGQQVTVIHQAARVPAFVAALDAALAVRNRSGP